MPNGTGPRKYDNSEQNKYSYSAKELGRHRINLKIISIPIILVIFIFAVAIGYFGSVPPPSSPPISSPPVNTPTVPLIGNRSNVTNGEIMTSDVNTFFNRTVVV